MLDQFLEKQGIIQLDQVVLDCSEGRLSGNFNNMQFSFEVLRTELSQEQSYFGSCSGNGNCGGAC